MSIDNFQPTLAADWLSALTLAASQLDLPTQDWTTFSPELNIMIALSRSLEALEIAAIERWRGSFLGYAEGDALTILCEQTFRTPRLGATYASTLVTFTNAGSVTRTIGAGDFVTLVVSDDETISRYRVDGPLVIPPGTLADIPAVAEVAGSTGDVNPGDLDEVEGSALPDVSITNTTVGQGRDIESDGDLQSRARLFASSLSITGPKGAYAYFARGGDRNGEIDPAIATIGVTRVKTVTALADGKVTAYFGTASGGITGTATTGNLGLINAKLFLRVVPDGTDYEGMSADPLTINTDGTVFVPDNLGVDEGALKAAIIARVKAYIESPDECPIGGPPEIVPTSGYTGSITVSKTRGLYTDIEVNGIRPVSNAVNTVNLGSEQLVLQNQVPVSGTNTLSVIFLPPQTP